MPTASTDPIQHPSFDAVLNRDPAAIFVALDFHGTVSAPAPRWPQPKRSQAVRTSFGEFTVTWAPGLREQLKHLAYHPRVQLVWVTSWGSDIALAEDVLGLPRLPYAIDRVLPREEVPAAKRAAIDRIAATGRPWVWCDDREATDVGTAGAGPHLAIRPRSRHGLTPAHLEQVWAFVNAAVASGHRTPSGSGVLA